MMFRALAISFLLACSPAEAGTHDISLPFSDTVRKGNYLKTSLIDSIIDEALRYQFERYRYAGKTPGGFDCSGFLYFIFEKFDIKMPSSSRNVRSIGEEIDSEEIIPGDIVYFTGRNAASKTPGHVGMVIKKDKDGYIWFIHSSVQKGVTVDRVDYPYYAKRFMGVRRITL